MSDLTEDQQENVRAALRFFRTRSGSWEPIGRALGFGKMTLSLVASGNKPVSPKMAFRVAKLAGVGVDDVLAGEFPAPGTCPMCGYHRIKGAEDFGGALIHVET